MVDDDTLAVAGELSKPTIRISLNNKKFRKMVGAEEVAEVKNDHLNVVIVKMSHTASRTYYEGVYQPGKIASPVCWSNDSKTADIEVPVAQAKSCYQCKYSVRGSGNNGVGTACKISWRIAVVLANDINGDILQLALPAMSCFGKEVSGRYPFRPYIQMLANNNVSAGRVVTKLQFDESVAIPKVLFSPFAAVSEEDLEILKKQAATREAQNATVLKVNLSNYDEQRPTVQFDVFLETPQKNTDVDTEREKTVSNIVNKWKNK